MLRFEQLRLSLLVDGFSKVSVDKWMDITEMGYVIASRYNNLTTTRFFCAPNDMCRSCVWKSFCSGLFERLLFFTASSVVVVNQLLFSGKAYTSLMSFKRDYVDLNEDRTCIFYLILTNKQFLDEIHYRQAFTHTGNQIRFQCMQLINDNDVNTMLMCNDQFSCVGPIELLCTIGRTPDEVINLLERTMTHTHDALLYYNGRWNMPPQNKFVGCAFTGKNPKKFEIPSGCTLDELKDLIKQVAPKGIPPQGIQESQALFLLNMVWNSKTIFHINKNVKAKCKSLIAQKNAWDYVMDCWGCLTDCPSEQQFDECLKKFEMACAPWPMFVDYVKETWIIPHKEKFVSAWTNKVMHLGNTTTNRYETVQLFLLTLTNLWNCIIDAMNNMIMLQHMEIKASFETSTHVVGHVFKKTLYKRLLGMVSRYALNQIAAKLERVDYAGKNPLSCGCMVRTTLGLPCAYELSKYVGGCIPLDSIHMFWRRLNFSDQGLSEPEVGIKDVMETISKKFEELDVCGKFTLRTKLWEIAYPDQNSMCPPPAKVNTKGTPKKTTSRNPRSTNRDPSYWEYVDAFESIQNSNSSVRRTASSSEQQNRRTMMPMLDQFQSFMHDFIDKIIDVKADGNCGYRSVAGLLGMGEDSWSVLFDGTERFEELRMSLLVDGLTKFDVYICFILVTTDKWMDITDTGHVIASRYNVIVVSLSKQQNMTFFPRRSQPLANSSLHRIICIGHVYGNHFVEVYLKERCPLPPVPLLWSSNCHPQAKSWPNPYISRMQHYKSFVMFKRDYVDINDD
ncbi:hypothetical protein HKD37_11G032010 [Glycine soja]